MQGEIELLKKVWQVIGETAALARRSPDEVRLIAVSKGHSADEVRRLRRAGVTTFGENYVQEFTEKYETLRDDDIRWHFIGHLQSNKVKYIVDKVECIHTVDSVKLAEEIDRQAEKKGIAQMPVLLQVNVGGEASKSGATADEALALFRGVSALPRLSVRGLMTLPPFLEPEEVRPYFRELRELLHRIQREGPADPAIFRELSMGMSGDFDVAIEEGATMIRLGTILFGERD